MSDNIVVPPSPTRFATNITHLSTATDHSAHLLPPTSDHLDLMNRIVGLYRLLDLISEDGSGGAGSSFRNALFMHVPALMSHL